MCIWIVCWVLMLVVVLGVLVLFFVVGNLVLVLMVLLCQSEWFEWYFIIIFGLYDSGWLFFEVIEEGKLVGLGYDYLQVVVECLGVMVQVCLYCNWIEVLDVVCWGEVDVVMNVVLMVDCICCMVYIWVYLDVLLVLVVCLDDICIFIDLDLCGLCVVIEEVFVISDQVCVCFLVVCQVSVVNIVGVLMMVIWGEVDVYIGNVYVVVVVIEQEYLIDISVLCFSDLLLECFYFGVLYVKQLLVEVLDIVLVSFGQVECDMIVWCWLCIL